MVYNCRMKAIKASEVQQFSDIPNIGPKMARDFSLLGMQLPVELKTKDAYTLYLKIGHIVGKRPDPCVLDTYMAAIDFMNGSPGQPWWNYTARRKQQYPDC